MGEIAKSVPTGTEDEENLVGHLALTDFTIEAFRGLQQVRLKDLSRVNLLVGGNNSGKTSVLEALAVFAAPFDVVEWAEIALLREGRPSFLRQGMMPGLEAIRWLFPQDASKDRALPGPVKLRAEGRWEVSELTASCAPIRGLASGNTFGFSAGPIQPSLVIPGMTEVGGVGGRPLTGYRVSVTVHPAPAGTPQPVEIDLWDGSPVLMSHDVQPVLPVVLLAPYAHRNQPMQLGQLSRLILSEQKEAIIRLLQGVDARILDLAILTEPDGTSARMMVKHERAGMVPVSVLGDGFRRILSVALSVSLASGGLLLIDELESALHARLLDQLFEWLVRACREANVQLFATTHSLEAVSAISGAAIRMGGNEICAYRLGVRDTTGGVKRFDADMLNRVVLEHGLDIR